MPAARRLQAVVLMAATNLLARAAEPRKLAVSGDCIRDMSAMMETTSWMWINTSFTRWCRVRAENEMTQCCTLADFASGRGEGCASCDAKCIHETYATLCNKYFGTACRVTRSPFRTETPGFKIQETFCVPSSCFNEADREGLMPYYATAYKVKRGGWHREYDDAELDCPSAVVGALLIVLAVLVFITCSVGCLIFLFKAPKVAGKQLMSQEDMMDDDDDPPDDFASTGMSRGGLHFTGTGGDGLDSSAMGATR